MVVALLRFDFQYADLIRWLSEEYNAHRNWRFSFAIAATVTDAAILLMGLKFGVAGWSTKRVYTWYPTSVSTVKSSTWPLSMLCEVTVGLC
jgi:hypothetical protein